MKTNIAGFLLVVATSATIGCDRSAPPPVIQDQAVSFMEPRMTADPDKKWIPGHDSTTLFGGISNGKTSFLIWTDVAYSDSYIFTAGGSGKYSGYLLPPGADRMEWECQTATNGGTGEMTLGGNSYDLSEGALFLVIRTSGNTSVKQVRQDLSTIGHGTDGFDDWCRDGGFKRWVVTVPEIKEFFCQSEDAQ